MSEDHREDPQAASPPSRRRVFLSTLPSVAMAGGLLASYGTLAAMAGRFLYPARPRATSWQFVTEVARLTEGDSLVYRMPSGVKVVIACQEKGKFLALSSTCPHLGCQVHWEPQKKRFFCPCHNGTFDPTGRPTGGPPAQAGHSLPRYPLKVENGLLFIEVPS